MSQRLTLQLSDEAYLRLQGQALAAGTSAAELAAASIERQFNTAPPSRSEAEKQAARERFQRHLGEVELGHPTGAENEEIDADLAAEYADTHEEGRL